MLLESENARPRQTRFFTDASGAPHALTADQVASYHERGYLHIPAIFTEQETDELSEHLNWVIENWAIKDQGWTGPWRQKYMDAATEKKSQLIALHDLQYYSDAWARAVVKPKLAGAMADLLGPVVEFHHSTLHVKPPETGHPFPMHQDWAFYKHADGRYVDVLVHLDDTRHENGEIRFLAGSHINTTDRARRLVRVGYKSPENEQLEGQSKGRPGLIVYGRRAHREGDVPLRQN